VYFSGSTNSVAVAILACSRLVVIYLLLYAFLPR
jgi:hypothetical protein